LFTVAETRISPAIGLYESIEYVIAFILSIMAPRSSELGGKKGLTMAEIAVT
jgi:hypothetical protein